MMTIDRSQLASVIGGDSYYQAGGQWYGDNGKANYPVPASKVPAFKNPSPPNPTAQGVAQYNNFYDNYTNLIDSLNGIGGGVATARTGTPSL